MTRIVFLDTETTSLRPDRRAWEVGLIAREPGRDDVEHQWFIDAYDLDLGNADVMSLKIGRFYERHPEYQLEREADFTETVSETEALRLVEAITRGAHLVGAVPNFDADVLGARMRAHGICPSWHYHLVDIEALAVGYLMRGRARAGFDGSMLPWKSDELSAELGVKVSDEDRHTALGDAKWARAIYDAEVLNFEETDDGEYVRYSGLSKAEQTSFALTVALFPFAAAKVATIKDEAAIYGRVNGGGTPQSDEDMDRAARIANEEV